MLTEANVKEALTVVSGIAGDELFSSFAWPQVFRTFEKEVHQCLVLDMVNHHTRPVASHQPP
jgi:hypothetical protein